MNCADYSGHCQAKGEVMCRTCGQYFCWDHILTLRFAAREAIVQERLLCRNCTERIFDELEEDRLQCKHDFRQLEQDMAALKRELENPSE